jgi:hypothetical protein
MYAFGVLCWEVMTRLRPFLDVEDEMELAAMLHDGEGLDLDKLPPEVPQSVVDMIKVGALCIMIATKLIRFQIVKQTLSSSLFYASYLILYCIVLYYLFEGSFRCQPQQSQNSRRVLHNFRSKL